MSMSLELELERASGYVAMAWEKIVAKQKVALNEKIEDYALVTVPEEQRRNGWVLSWMTMGITTILVQQLIGSY